jgi:hypothetical protein
VETDNWCYIFIMNIVPCPFVPVNRIFAVDSCLLSARFISTKRLTCFKMHNHSVQIDIWSVGHARFMSIVFDAPDVEDSRRGYSTKLY